MSILKVPPKVRLFFGIIFNNNINLTNCLGMLKEKYGDIIFESTDLNFNSTNYYENEMGDNLSRKFIAFKELIDRNDIVNIKIYANDLEETHSNDNRRTINLDPGYIASEHIILATGKGFAHRPYLGKGVYADLTLLYRKNKFEFLDWTYPDYKDINIQNIFLDLRNGYLSDLKKGSLK